MGLKNTSLFTLLLMLALGLGSSCGLQAQETNVDSSEKMILPSTSLPFKRGDFRAKITEDYLKKFTEMSDELQVKEDELGSLQVRLEAVKERAKSVKEKPQKDLFKENIKTLKIGENQLITEVRLIKKALRLLQENKAEPDPGKMRVLHEITGIEDEIANLRLQSETEKSELVLEKITFNDRDVYMDPPGNACDVVYNGIDAGTEKSRKELAKEFLFGYTHPKLKSFFKDEHYLQCDAKLVELDKKKYLWLYITIASKEAIKSYGYIQRNSPLKFELLNGEILYATSAQNSSGRLEAYTGNTLYEVILPLDKSKYKQFSKGEIDRIGIMWSSGYEQYEVFNVDVLMKQIECLENL